MSVLMHSALIGQFTRQSYDIGQKMVKLRQKLLKLQKYSTQISDGGVSLNDMMNAPAGFTGRQLMFMQYSHNFAMMNAQAQMQQAMPMMQMQMSQMDPQMQQYIVNNMFQNFYKQQREVAKQQEVALMNEEEQQIQQELEQLKAEKAMVDQALESAKQERDKSIQGFFGKA